MEDKLSLRNMTTADWPYVSQIYQEGLNTGHASFEQTAPSWEDWDKSHLTSCRWVAVRESTLVGWAALTGVSGRCVYAGVAEVSVYVSQSHRGHKVGQQLLHALIQSSEENGLWTLQAGIFPQNKASIKLHQNLGFRQIGYREKIGKLNGQWQDTILFEKRSEKVGLN